MSNEYSRRFRPIPIVSVALAAAVGFGADAAHAGSLRCGYSQGSWNAPRGAVVVMHTDGIVSQVFQAGGAYLTHIMLSHGTGWMSHAHRGNPMRNSDFDAIFGRPLATSPGTLSSGNPISTLKAGQPGASTATMGGTYTSMYGDGSGGQPSLVMYRVGDSRAASVENFVWNMPLKTIIDKNGSPTSGVYQLLDRHWVPPFWIYPGYWSEQTMPYSFYQFKEIGTNHLGVMSPDGVACSTFISWAIHRANNVSMTPRVYNEATVRHALQVAHDATRDECHAGFGDWFQHTLANLGNACDKAGNQIADCMAGTNGGKCDNYGDEYTNPNNWGGGRDANVISPDRVVNYDATLDTASPWARSGLTGWGVVQWSGEPRYGCWVSDDHFQP
ncbi:MAG: hypothetical protein KC776_29250 [Myxococcales bacterium]|nr:hypothetical protein [Myxococcales bacterium]MCB9582488.1 hypothetical protein [Polyangiaceae bacterium]